MSVDNTSKYDIGLPSSPYFKDANEGKKIDKIEHYCDCKGNGFCIVTEELLPYFQKYEFIAPLFISTTWGSEKYYKAKVTKPAYKIRGKSFLHLNRPLQVGEIIKIKGDCCAKYYLTKKLKKRDKFNSFIYHIARIDGHNIVQLDLDKFKKEVTVSVKGYFSNK